MFGRFIYVAAKRKKTSYVITQSRVFIFSGVFKETIEFIDIKKTKEIHLLEHYEGTGTVVLGSITGMGMGGMYRGTGLPPNMAYLAHAIERIEEAKKVYSLLKRIQLKK